MEKNCPNCNRPNAADAAFCRHCASPLDDVAAGGPQPRSSEAPRRNPAPNQPHSGAQQTGFAGPSTGGGNQKAMLAVGLAAAGLFCCGPVTGIPAAILGWLEMTAIREGRSPKENMWMAQVGLWGGIAVSILGTIGWFFMMLLSMASGPGYY